MNPEIRLAICLVAITLATWLPVTSAEVFSSLMKVERMIKEEAHILNELKHYIDNQYQKLQEVTNFYEERLRHVQENERSDLVSNLKHPNAVFSAINQFVTDYSEVLGDHFESFQRAVKASVNYLADWNDIRGARLALVRLQSVYNLNPMDMIRGDYLGVQGPKLDAVDAYDIGETCVSEGKLNESLKWLNVSAVLTRSRDSTPQRPGPTLGTILALMGRVHVYAGNTGLAHTLYNEAVKYDPVSHEVIQLAEELQTQPRIEPEVQYDYFQNFSKLCSLESRYQVADPTNPRIVCRYRPVRLPYYRFKEEIMSVAPFASVIYDAISDQENEHFKDHVKNRLKRGTVGGDQRHILDIRTSDLGWISDAESEIAKTVSKRIEYITGLDTKQRGPDAPDSSEAFQVVNYGLGGHYEVHMDPLGSPTTLNELNDSGDRIATFLIYLSDVQKGGATVFTRVGVSVPPVKNMALLWYNFDPAYHEDDLTYHAGCPVLIGQKWIANKWIWTYGNTFRRRCGLAPDATQLDIEPEMMRDYQQ